MKLLSSFYKNVIENFCFSEEVYTGMKSVAKFKFMFIGLSIWQMLLQGVS